MRARFAVIAVGAIIGSGVYLSVAAMKARDEEKYPSPKYQVLGDLGRGVELRHYENSLIAQVQVTGDEKTALNEGFRILAAYIFGKNVSNSSIKMTSPVTAESEKIQMTSPVTSQPGADVMTVSFFMPAGYSRQTLPLPEDSRIQFVELPERKVAAIRFSGSWNPRSFRKHAHILIERLHQNNLEPKGMPLYAYYNPPFMPPFMRRNEVLLSLHD